jgi:hypothetical protein
MRLTQVFAFKRTGERDLAFRSAANAADISLHRRTGPFGAALTAELAQNYFRHLSLSSVPGIIETKPMKRVDLYIKVQVELDEDEKPDRVAREICRQLEKIYVVRTAELSSAVSAE